MSIDRLVSRYVLGAVSGFSSSRKGILNFPAFLIALQKSPLGGGRARLAASDSRLRDCVLLYIALKGSDMLLGKQKGGGACKPGHIAGQSRLRDSLLL